MRYAIYWTMEDGTTDTTNQTGSYARDMTIAELKLMRGIKEIRFCKIYKSGEYGCRKTVLKGDE